ncbi:universal stress protein [Nonomuraea aurantiaca]|uniref:universal stress protein n=1 Tax=Nonomuraea aurantiaca TaxID=2878562 RepID=UPI001CD9D9D8|nr:universal stress protein [Nonomuraea aurantiaca]MCA2230167.1 universal stress protein [Nonomuraea aurantiaca]
MAGQIVVGVDGSAPATAAVEWAADDASRRGRSLRLVHVCEQWAPSLGKAQWPLSLDEAEAEYSAEALQAAANRAHELASGVDVTTELREGNIVEQLIAESASADSVVLGSRGLGGFTGMVLGSVSMAVAGHAAGPVVVVRGPVEGRHGQIVVGYDGSERARAAMEYAIEQARARQARLQVVYAWQAPLSTPYATAYSSALESAFEQQKRAAREAVSPWREKNPDVELTDEQVCEHPVAALMNASASADLVVVGSRGMGGFASAMLGSVSRGVLHHVTCPVAVIRPRG